MSRVNLRFLILLLLTINLIRETEEKIREKRMIPRRNRNTIRSYGGAVGGIGTSEDGNRNSRIELDPNDRNSHMYGPSPVYSTDGTDHTHYPNGPPPSYFAAGYDNLHSSNRPSLPDTPPSYLDVYGDNYDPNRYPPPYEANDTFSIYRPDPSDALPFDEPTANPRSSDEPTVNPRRTGGEYPGILRRAGNAIARNIRQNLRQLGDIMDNPDVGLAYHHVVSFDPNAYSQGDLQTGNGQRRYDEHYGERTDEPRF